MTAPRRRKGLEAIRDAADAVEPAPTIHVLMLNGIPRGLTTKEVAAHFGLPYKRILAEIHAGRIRVISGGLGLRRSGVRAGHHRRLGRLPRTTNMKRLLAVCARHRPAHHQQRPGVGVWGHPRVLPEPHPRTRLQLVHMLTNTTPRRQPMDNVCDMDFSVGAVNGQAVTYDSPCEEPVTATVEVDGVAYDVCSSHAGYLSKATTVVA